MRIVAGCVFLTLSVSACLDTGGNPLAVPVTPETQAAVLFSQDLSTVPNLYSLHGLTSHGYGEVAAWWNSWEMGEVEGDGLRARLYPVAARRLFPVLGVTGVKTLVSTNAGHLASVQAAAGMVSSGSLSRALERAEDLQTRAGLELGRGNGEAALAVGLQTADALWAISPRQVAADLIDKATEALGRNQEAATYSEEELVRIRRLVYGASEALEEEDYPRAIRRAYYACQLLGAYIP